MVETRRSPVAPLAPAMERASLAAAILEPTPFLAVVGLRADRMAQARVAATLGTPLPGANRLAATALGAVLCMGPDEWLVVGADGT